MKFSHPHMFYLIWLVVMLLGFMIYGNRKRARIVQRFISSSLISTMVPDYSIWRKWLKGSLLTLSLLFLVLALTGPLVGFRWEEVKEKGVDIMIALDCSRSMLATDIKPSRLEQAKREIVDLLNMMHSDRAGLVAFAGTAILQCPLTLDHSGFTIFLNALNPDFLPMGGTDISGALQTAINGFEADSDSEKAIIVITDGENTSGDPISIATDAAKKGVRIFCIGVGQEDGAPIPDPNGGFKKDDNGKIIMSKVDDEGLRKIAAVGNGIYVKSVAGDMDLDQIYTGEIQKNMKKTTLHSGRTKVWENRFQWMLLPAVLFLVAEMAISERKKVKQGIFTAALLIGILSSLMAGDMNNSAYASSSASVKKGLEAYEKGKYDDALKNFIDAQLERPDLPELYYNIGSAAYKKQDYESALNNFTRAKESKDKLLKEKSSFNLGNTKYRMGDLEGAINEFGQIPKDSELHNEAKENIEFVKKKIEEQKKKDQEKQDQDKKDQEKKDQNKKDQNKKDQNKKDQNKKDQDKKDQDKKDQEKKDQNKQDQDKKDQDKKDQDKNKQEQKKSQEDKQKQAQQQEQNEPNQDQQPQSAQAGDEKSDNQQSRQHLLNRLEDKPGSAMMPVYSERPVLKDW